MKLLSNIILFMGRGRKPIPRNNDLGHYIADLRSQHEWSLSYLAEKVGVSYQTLSRLELGLTHPRHFAELLINIANEFGIDPNRLLVRAVLTPMLRPSVVNEEPERKQFIFYVDENEAQQLENYLQFLRDVSSVESVRRGVENK